MRAVWIDVPESFLEERHRLGHDKKDELWEGVLHMVPPPSNVHVLVNLAKIGVREIWLVEPSNRATEMYELAGDSYREVPFVNGAALSPVLGIELRVADGRLELRDGDEIAVI